MQPVGFEPTISAGERPQTHSLDRAATGTGNKKFKDRKCYFQFIITFYLFPMPPHVLRNFRGFPPGCGDSVADFWGWDAHEARLRCPDVVSGDMQEDEIPGGASSLNLLPTQTMVTTGIFLCKEKFPW